MFKSINKLKEGTFVRLLDRHGKERHLMASRRLDIGDGSGYDNAEALQFHMLPQIETLNSYLIMHNPQYDEPDGQVDTVEPFPTPWLVYDMDGEGAGVWWVALNDNWDDAKAPHMETATSPAILHPCRLT